MISIRPWSFGPKKPRPGTLRAVRPRRRVDTGCSTRDSSRPRSACIRKCQPSSPRGKRPGHDPSAPMAKGVGREIPGVVRGARIVGSAGRAGVSPRTKPNNALQLIASSLVS